MLSVDMTSCWAVSDQASNHMLLGGHDVHHTVRIADELARALVARQSQVRESAFI